MNTKEIIATIISLILLFLLEWLIGLYLWSVIAVGIFGLPSLNAMEFLGLFWLINILTGSTASYSNFKTGEERDAVGKKI